VQKFRQDWMFKLQAERMQGNSGWKSCVTAIFSVSDDGYFERLQLSTDLVLSPRVRCDFQQRLSVTLPQ